MTPKTTYLDRLKIVDRDLLKWIALAWPAALHVYFDLFSGAIQTYVFCMLTMTYVNQAIEDGEY